MGFQKEATSYATYYSVSGFLFSVLVLQTSQSLSTPKDAAFTSAYWLNVQQILVEGSNSATWYKYLCLTTYQ